MKQSSKKSSRANADRPKFRTERLKQVGKRRRKIAIALDNGATLVKLATTRQMQSLFAYSDLKYSFRVYASRWSEELQPLDTWTVSLGLAISQTLPSLQSELTSSEALRIAENISAALQAWPTQTLKNAVPLRRAKFLMTGWPLWTGKDIEFVF